MQDQLQIAVDRIPKFQAYTETAKNAQDKDIIEQSVLDARNELIIIHQCLENVMTEGELIFNSALRRAGLKALLDATTKKVDTPSAPQQTQEQFVVPQYLGAQVQHLGAETQPLVPPQTIPVEEQVQQTAP